MKNKGTRSVKWNNNITAGNGETNFTARLLTYKKYIITTFISWLYFL